MGDKLFRERQKSSSYSHRNVMNLIILKINKESQLALGSVRLLNNLPGEVVENPSSGTLKITFSTISENYNLQEIILAGVVMA